MEQNSYHEHLRKQMDYFAHGVYKATKKFPKEELYGITSQIRRSSLSVVLNYIEGYARQRDKVLIQFLETAYGSLKETMYLLDFCIEEQFITKADYIVLNKSGDEIARMLWAILKRKKESL